MDAVLSCGLLSKDAAPGIDPIHSRMPVLKRWRLDSPCAGGLRGASGVIVDE